MSRASALRLMCITAHPDDESLGFGGTLARYASEGVELSLVVGTRGERGRHGDGSEQRPSAEELGRIRESELQAACDVLGVHHLRFLDYKDAELDRADPAEASGRIAGLVRELRPQVVLTFDPFGVYGHPDHIAISQLALGGVLRAASSSPLEDGPDAPHQVQKLYYRAWTDASRDLYQNAFKALQVTVDGEVRPSVAWPTWSVTTTTDAHDHWKKVWAAIQCHRTQMAQYGVLSGLTAEDHRALWGFQEYYRAFSLVNGGREREADLFEGLR